mgnify:CR=1 FL=1
MIDNTCVYSHICQDKIDICRCRNYRQATNADRIRSMSDEELAGFCAAQRAGVFYKVCEEVGVKPELDASALVSEWLDWLRSPVENE